MTYSHERDTFTKYFISCLLSELKTWPWPQIRRCNRKYFVALLRKDVRIMTTLADGTGYYFIHSFARHENSFYCYCTQCFVMSWVNGNILDTSLELENRKVEMSGEIMESFTYIAEMIRRGMKSCYLLWWQPNEDIFLPSSRLCSMKKLSVSSSC